jgi:RNA polymerase sigma factor (sigma-70 family)
LAARYLLAVWCLFKGDRRVSWEVVITRSGQVVELYREFGAELWRALLVVSGGRSDLAEDAVAEAFARYLSRAATVRDPRAWLYRTGFRLVVSEMKKERREREVSPAHPGAGELMLSLGLREAIRGLTPEQRLVTFLVYQVDLPLAEVARLTGSSVAAVKMRLHRARRVLRAELKEDTSV